MGKFLFGLFFFVTSAFAQEQYVNLVPLGSGNQYACLYTNLNNTYLSKFRQGQLLIVKPTSLKNQTRAQISSLQAKIAIKPTAKLKRQLKAAKTLLSDIGKCSKRTIFEDVFSACRIISGEFRSNRIIDGSYCGDANSPYISLQIGDSEGNYTCSASIIAPNVVLTASHCLIGMDFVQTNIDGEINSAVGIVIHPQTNGVGINDLGIVTFQNNFTTRAPALLNGSGFIKVDPYVETGIIGGYGRDNAFEIGSLKAAAIDLFYQTEYGIFGSFSPNSGYQYKGGTCGGDSGGPLLVRRNGKWVITGTTSSGINPTCGLDGQPKHTYFTDLTEKSNIDFIKTNVPKAIFWR